jgi:putative transposase
LAVLEQYFEVQKSKTTNSKSRKACALNQKRARQRSLLPHGFARDTEVSTIIVGGLKDIREGKDWGNSGNQQLHKWPFDRIIKMLMYKARLKGIHALEEKEH